MFDFLIHHMADFISHFMICQNRELAFIYLLRGALTSMVNTQKTFDIVA
jgi:hypothetical protein